MNEELKNEKRAVKAETFSEIKRVDSRVLAVNMYLQGFGFNEIHDRLKEIGGKVPALKSVQAWIDEHIKVMKLQRPDLVENFKFVELEKINNLEREYWKAWQLSISPQITTKQTFAPPDKVPGKRIRRSVKQPLGDLKQTVRETKTQTGEPRYMQGVQWCVEQRIQILGLEAPRKNQIQDSAEAQELKRQMEERESGPRTIVFKKVGS